MKIAIIDDLPTDQNTLLAVLPSCFQELGFSIIKLDIFSSGEALLETFQTGSYDILFMDIYMSGITGMETAQRIRELDTSVKIVFISTSNEFAAESYEVHADFYLLKPYSREQIIKMLSSIHLSLYEQNRILVLEDGQKLLLHSIVYTSYHGHYETIYLQDGTSIRLRTSHTSFCEVLAPFSFFISCNKGMLVNLEKVEQLTPDCFILTNQDRIPISRRRYPEIQKAYADYLIAITRRQD